MSNFIDDILGRVNLIEQAIGRAYMIARNPKARNKQKYSKMDIVKLTVPRRDKVQGAPQLRQCIAHLKRYGVDTFLRGFNSREQWIHVRRNQEKWARRLMNYDASGVPRFWHPNSAWADDTREQRRARPQRRRRRR